MAGYTAQYAWPAGRWAYTLGAGLGWLLRARSRYLVHSPQAYALAEALYGSPSSPKEAEVLAAIRAYRYQLAHAPTKLVVDDLGATPGTRQATLAQLTRRSARGAASGRLLHRLLGHTRPTHALELGTHLGFSAAYMLSGHPTTNLVGVEGAAAVAARARQTLVDLGYKAQVVTAPFADYLATPPAQPWDLVFLDGHHTQAATQQYLDALWPHLAPGAWVVMDDLYWSAGMARAWQAAQHRPGVVLAVDTFRLGILKLAEAGPGTTAPQRLRLRPGLGYRGF